MESSAAAEADAEAALNLPECPVCLQPYDETATIPRVLPCGHSACELCLSLLPSPPAHPNTVRCPACVQLARFPAPTLGPKSLPKNIDLLRFCSPNPKPNPKLQPNPVSKPEPQSKPDIDVHFIPRKWTEELFRGWEPWILPEDSVSVTESSGDQNLVFGTHQTLSGDELQRKVSLFPICVSSNVPKWLQLRYVPRVMESLSQLEEKIRIQLKFILEVSLRQRSSICQVFGLWMNPNEATSPLFLVCERLNQSLICVLNDDDKWRLGLETDGKFGFGIVGMELCEAVMNFHFEGVAFGCLDLDCFSFDQYGHCLLNLNNVLVKATRLHKGIEDENSDFSKIQQSLSPEVFFALHGGSFHVDYASDVWSLGCMLAMLLACDSKHDVDLDSYCLLLKGGSGKLADTCLNQYEVWKDKVISKLEGLLIGSKLEPLLQKISSCLQYHLESRPLVSEVWCCIRSQFIEVPADNITVFSELEDKKTKKKLVSCLFLGNISCIPKEIGVISQQQGYEVIPEDVPVVGLAESRDININHLHREQADGNDGFRFDTLQGHHDCITGLAVGGAYLFSSSFDKTVNVWSLQDFSLVQSLRGHEHRVMAMVVVDEPQPLCISGDSASGIFVWRISTSSRQELLKKWYEANDWRFSGIHSLAISGGFLYSGSGDKSIKAWSLQDYSLVGTMTGHNSTVSSLTVANGILYSGSWDGTIRLWCLSDYSLLSILGDDTLGAVIPILSLSLDHHFLVSAYENGSIKIWKNDAFVRSEQIHDGAIFAVHVATTWLFTGGWNRFINIQELSEQESQTNISPVASITCDSVITSLLAWHGKLFVGFSNKEIKVYYYGTK